LRSGCEVLDRTWAKIFAALLYRDLTTVRKGTASATGSLRPTQCPLASSLRHGSRAPHAVRSAAHFFVEMSWPGKIIRRSTHAVSTTLEKVRRSLRRRPPFHQARLDAGPC